MIILSFYIGDIYYQNLPLSDFRDDNPEVIPIPSQDKSRTNYWHQEAAKRSFRKFT